MSSGRGCPVACSSAGGGSRRVGVAEGGGGRDDARLGRRWILGIWKGKGGTSRGWGGGGDMGRYHLR